MPVPAANYAINDALPEQEQQTSYDTLESQNDARRQLRLLTYNIQTGIATNRYRDYLTHSWKHLLPYPERIRNLRRIAGKLERYDLVGLQEVDAGSLRSGFINITEYLAHKSQFPHWYDQTNRDLGNIARHSIGLLSRLKCDEVTEHKLPGFIPGRGAMVLRFGRGDDALVIVIMHLALGKRTRMRQLEFISELVSEFKHVILMGDLNCASDSQEMDWLMSHTSLHEPIHGLYTFPSWQPFKNLDHILVSPSLEVQQVKVMNYQYSDHLPLSMVVNLPDNVILR